MKKILVATAILTVMMVGYFCVGLLSTVNKWGVVKEDLPNIVGGTLLRAELGEPLAQINLGILYELKGAMNPDRKAYYLEKADYWYKRAAWKADGVEKYRQRVKKEYDAF